MPVVDNNVSTYENVGSLKHPSPAEVMPATQVRQRSPDVTAEVRSRPWAYGGLLREFCCCDTWIVLDAIQKVTQKLSFVTFVYHVSLWLKVEATHLSGRTMYIRSRRISADLPSVRESDSFPATFRQKNDAAVGLEGVWYVQGTLLAKLVQKT